MMRFILDCLRPTRQRAGERDISLEKVTRENETSNQENNVIEELQEEVSREEVGLKEEQEQRHETQEALDNLAKQRTELRKQIELIQLQRKEERQLLLSLQEEQEELEQSVQEYEEELSRAQEELQRLQEDVTLTERKVEGARFRISPLQNSISQSYAEISRVGVSLAQQRLGELIAELIAVEGPVAMGVRHGRADEEEEAQTDEDCLERSLEDEEQDDLCDRDLEDDQEEPCGRGGRAEEQDRPNPVTDALKSSGSSSFTEITLTEVKEEEGSSPRSLTPQIDSIDSPDLEEEEEGSTVQSLMTQTSSHTTIGQFDFYQPDPFTDNDLFRDDLFPKVEVTDSTDGFFSDPFKGTDPFASDYIFNQFEEEPYQPSDHLSDREHESELGPVPESTTTTNMNNSEPHGTEDVGDTHLPANEQYDGATANLNSEGFEAREECDGFEISVPVCSEHIHADNSPNKVAEESAYMARFESGYTPKPGLHEPNDDNPLSADLSDEEGQKSEGREINNSYTLTTDSGSSEGQGRPTECNLSNPRAPECDRYDPSGSEGTGSPIGDPVHYSIAETKRQARRHFSCDAHMALSLASPDEMPGCQEAFCPEGGDINGWQPEDAEVCDANSINVEFSQRIRGSFVAPKFTDQEVIGWSHSNGRNCDGCVFELCHHYPTSAETLDSLRANEDDSEYRNCTVLSSETDITEKCNASEYEHGEPYPLKSLQVDEYAKHDIDQTRTNHNVYSTDLTNTSKPEVCKTPYRYVDPFSPEQNNDSSINFGAVKEVEHNVLVPISMPDTSSDAKCIELKPSDPFSPDGVGPVTPNANTQQITDVEPCHLEQNTVFMYNAVASKHTDSEFFSSVSSWNSLGSEPRDPEASTSQCSDACLQFPQKNLHSPNVSNMINSHSFNSDSEDSVCAISDSVCAISESQHTPVIIHPEPSGFGGLKSISPEPTSDSDGCYPEQYDSGCYDTSKTVNCDLRPPELMQFDPFSPDPSDAEMCDVGSESNHCSYSAFFETAPNGPSRFSSWGLEPSMFSSEGSHGSEHAERCEYTPTGTSSDDSVRGHPFDSESSETTGWSLSEFDFNRSAVDQNPEDVKEEKATPGSDTSDQDGSGSELNRVARSSRHSSVPDSIAEMLFGPEPSSARFYPWDIENSNTIVCDNHSPEDSPDTLQCDLGLVSGYDINSGVAVNAGASEVPNLR